jgi:hypothetical protein
VRRGGRGSFPEGRNLLGGCLVVDPSLIKAPVGGGAPRFINMSQINPMFSPDPTPTAPTHAVVPQGMGQQQHMTNGASSAPLSSSTMAVQHSSQGAPPPMHSHHQGQGQGQLVVTTGPHHGSQAGGRVAVPHGAPQQPVQGPRPLGVANVRS